MADTKLSALTEVTSLTAADEIYINDGGTSKRITWANFEGTFITPALGTPASGVMTNVTGTAASLTAGLVSSIGNLTGHITSVNRATVLGSFTVAQLSTALSDASISGSNTGDQTSIAGITGTKAQFDTAATDGNFLYVGDVTTNATHTGDATGATALTLAAAAISGKATVTAVGTDFALILDTSDSPNALKKALVSDFGSGDALVANPLSQFAATTSLQLKNTISDETGSGLLVFGTSPTLITPALGTPSALVGTNITGTAASLTAGNATLAASVTTNANLTGPVTSVGNATAIANKALAIAKLADGTDGELITWDATGVIATVPVGTLGHVLTSGGVGVAPTFQVGGGGSGAFTADGDTQITPTTAIVLDQDTGDEDAVRIDYQTNKSSSGDDSGLVINLTDTASPGVSLLQDWQVGGVTQARINNAGDLIVQGDIYGSDSISRFYPDGNYASTYVTASSTNLHLVGGGRTLSIGAGSTSMTIQPDANIIEWDRDIATATIRCNIDNADNATGAFSLIGKPAFASASTNLVGGDIDLTSGDGASGSAGLAHGGAFNVTGGTGYGTGDGGDVVVNGGVASGSGTVGNISLGNYTFDGDQTVGAGQDNYVLTYDDGTGLVTLEASTGSGDMLLAGTQTVTGAKTFLDTTLLLRNVANTFNGSFVNTNTADRIYTLQDAAGTLAFTTDITGTNSNTNTGDQTDLTGISDNKAAFDGALSDGTFLYTGDVTSNVSTTLVAGTVTATTYGITSDGGADDIILPEATTSFSGLLGSAKWDEIVANTAKVSNATHTGDVTGSVALTIAVDAVDIPMLSATGVADATTFLRGDNTWATPAGSGDMVLASAQTITGAKTFDTATLLLNDTDSVFDLELGSTSTITSANKTLIFDVNDANRTLTISGDATVTGSNTGDQTDLTSISDTKANFDTACSDGNFIFVGDAPTAHTIVSHSDTTATGAELDTLTDGSNADALHVHAGAGAFAADVNTQITPTTAIVLDQDTGDEDAVRIDYQTNKSSSGDDTGLTINQTDTLSPGVSLLLDAQVAGVSKFRVSNTGNVNIAGTPTSQLLDVTNNSGSGSNGRAANFSASSHSDYVVQLAYSGAQSKTSGQHNALQINPTYNQSSGTGANTDIFVNRTETAVGSGEQNLLDMQVGAVSKYRVDNTGQLEAGIVPFSRLADGTDGELITWDASGVIAAVPAGSATEVLTSNGPGAVPTFQTAAGGGDMTLAGTQTVTGAKTFDTATLLLNDTDSVFDLALASTSTITTANKTLTFDVNDSDRTLTLGGNFTLDQSVAIAAGPAFTSAQLTTPVLGIPTSGTLTNCDGTAASLTAGTVSTIAGLAPDTATTQATQGNITSLGVLTTLTVDNITVNGSDISHATAVDMTLTATAGNAVAVEGVSFDGGVVTGASSITATTLVGELTGNAATVTTIAGLAPNTATTQATQASITTCTNLVTVGAIGTGTWEATDVAVLHGGTGASDAGTARTNLGVDVVKANNLLTKAITVESPTASENISMFFTTEAITVTQITAVIQGSTSVSFDIEHGTSRASVTGTGVIGTDEVADSTTTGNITTSFTDATIPADSFVWLSTSALSGTPTELNVTIEYTVD